MPLDKPFETNSELSETMADFALRRKREQGRFWARQPKPIGKIMSKVMLQGGYGRQMAAGQLDAAWKIAAGEAFGKDTRAGKIRKGCLSITARNSIVKQELTYSKEEILQRIQAELPELDIRDLRVQIGKIV